MNSLFIEPGLPFDTQKLMQLLQKLALEARLEVDVVQLPNKEELPQKLEQAIAKNPDTIIALGGFSWLDTIISESCRLSHAGPNETPIFAHISPPEKLALTWRIAPYMERGLKRSMQAIAARKITEQKAFVCADTIWFTHTLRIKNDTSSEAPSRFLVSTPNGSELRIDAPVELVTISVHEDITSREQHIITITAEKRHTIHTTKLQEKDANLLEKKLKTRTVQKTTEDVFHIQASRIDVHTPHHFASEAFSKNLPEKFRIEPAQFSIKMITEKNDILKY